MYFHVLVPLHFITASSLCCCSARESTLNEPSNLTTGEVNQDTNDVRLVRALISLFNSGELVKLWINHYEVCFEPFPICILWSPTKHQHQWLLESTCNTIFTRQNTIFVLSELKVDEQSSVEKRNPLYPTYLKSTKYQILSHKQCVFLI